MEPTSSATPSPVSPITDPVLYEIQDSASEAAGSVMGTCAFKDVSITNVWPCLQGDCTVRFTASTRGEGFSLSVLVSNLNNIPNHVLVFDKAGIDKQYGLAHAHAAARVVHALLRGEEDATQCHTALRLLDNMWERSIDLRRTTEGDKTFFAVREPLLERLFKVANPSGLLGAPRVPAPAPAAPQAAVAVAAPPTRPAAPIKVKKTRKQRKPRKNAAPVVACTCVNCGAAYTLFKRQADKGGHKTCSKKCSYQYRTAKAMLTRAAKKTAKQEAEAAAAEAAEKARYPYTSGGFPLFSSGLPEGGIHAMPVHLPPQRRFDKYGYERPPSVE